MPINHNLENRERYPAGESPARPKPSEQAGSESCVVRERSRLRSVDSEQTGRVIEPRNATHRGGRRRIRTGRQHRVIPQRKDGSAHRGQRAGHVCTRVAQEPGRSRRFLHNKPGSRATGDQRPGPSRKCSSGAGSEQESTVEVPLSEGNEVMGDERLEVGSPHSTAEVGERYPGGPGGGKGETNHGIV